MECTDKYMANLFFYDELYILVNLIYLYVNNTFRTDNYYVAEDFNLIVINIIVHVVFF